MFAILKPKALAILRPITGFLIRHRVHPNALSALGFVLSCVAGVLFALGSLRWGATFVLMSGLFDILDGAVAREGHTTTRYGAFLDSNLDRYAEIVVFVGLLWHFSADPWMQLAAILAITGSLMVSYTKARAEGLGQSVHGGFLQRPERIILLSLSAYFGQLVLQGAIWVMAALTHLTSIQRMALVAMSMGPDDENEEETDEDGLRIRPGV